MEYRQVQLIRPGAAIRGLAVDRRGALYAACDSGIHVFDPAGRLLRRWPTSHPPHSVAVDCDGDVWAGEDNRIEIFDPAGKPLRAWPNLGGRITALGFLNDSVLAADAADRAIHRFDPSGALRNKIGKNNPVNGFLIPNGVLDFALDAHGVIHAANPGKHRVERYSAAGLLLGHIGRFHGNDPAGFTGCCNPTNVAVAGDRIYVTEKAVPRAKAYDFSGNLLAVVASSVFDPNVKNMSIAATLAGRVYVVDTVKLAILAFEPVTS